VPAKFHFFDRDCNKERDSLGGQGHSRDLPLYIDKVFVGCREGNQARPGGVRNASTEDRATSRILQHHKKPIDSRRQYCHSNRLGEVKYQTVLLF